MPQPLSQIPPNPCGKTFLIRTELCWGFVLSGGLYSCGLPNPTPLWCASLQNRYTLPIAPRSWGVLTGCGKSVSRSQERTSAAESRTDFAGLTARVEPVLFPNPQTNRAFPQPANEPRTKRTKAAYGCPSQCFVSLAIHEFRRRRSLLTTYRSPATLSPQRRRACPYFPVARSCIYRPPRRRLQPSAS